MKIFAAIVTYNRSELVGRAIHATLDQSFAPDVVAVIDNASTDDTTTTVAGFADTRVRYFQLTKNLGGAGGFAMAMTLFLASDCDAVWLLDDDGYPGPDALHHNVERMGALGLDVTNSLVVRDDRPQTLSFGLAARERDTGKRHRITDVGDLSRFTTNGAIHDDLNPFNGTLIKREVIEAVGPVDHRLFIWGDEVDFMARASRGGAKSATVVDALHFHPADKRQLTRVPLFGQSPLPPEARGHFWYRNRGYLLRSRPRSAFKAFRRAVKIASIYTVLGRPRLAWRYVGYFFDGYTNRFRLTPDAQSLDRDFREAHEAIVAKGSRQRTAPV